MPVVDVDRLKEQSRRFVDGFTPGQKAMTILGVVAVVLAGMTFMKWAAKPHLAAKLNYGIHGGPFSSYGPVFSTDDQLYAAAGYMVVYSNPRGSTS